MILLWLGLTALLQSCVTLFPDTLFTGAAWVQLFIFAVLAAGMIYLTRKLRGTPVFGIRDQWLIIAAILTLLLTQGGRPGHAGEIAQMIGIDVVTSQYLAHLSLALLIVGLWQALSNLARSKAQAVRALEAELHNALTEMVIEPVVRLKPPSATRKTLTGLTPALQQSLDLVGPAHRMLRDLVIRDPNNIAARLALHKRLREDPTQIGAMQQHAIDFISALHKADRLDLALDVAEECARHDANYYPAIDDALALALRAILDGKNNVALRLLKHFDVRYPNSPFIPNALLLSARALGGLGRNAPAQALLNALVEHYPDNELAADAIALSARLAVKR